VLWLLALWNVLDACLNAIGIVDTVKGMMDPAHWFTRLLFWPHLGLVVTVAGFAVLAALALWDTTRLRHSGPFSLFVAPAERMVTSHAPPDGADITVSASFLFTNLTERDLLLTPFLIFAVGAARTRFQCEGFVRLTPLVQSHKAQISCTIHHADAILVGKDSGADHYCDALSFSKAELFLRDEHTGDAVQCPPYFDIPKGGVVLRSHAEASAVFKQPLACV
jgi:hypothetical protein